MWVHPFRSIVVKVELDFSLSLGLVHQRNILLLLYSGFRNITMLSQYYRDIQLALKLCQKGAIYIIMILKFGSIISKRELVGMGWGARGGGGGEGPDTCICK